VVVDEPFEFVGAGSVSSKGWVDPGCVVPFRSPFLLTSGTGERVAAGSSDSQRLK
jgi:hypothetical protein